MSIALYKLTSDFAALMDDCEDDISSALADIVAGEIEAKAESICKFLTVLESSAEQFKIEEKRIADNRKALENKAARVREYIKQSMLNANIDKLQAGTYKLSVGLSQGSLQITDITKVPSKFVTIIQQVVPDKDRIKKAIKDGEQVAGCHIEAGTTLRIK